MQGANSSLRYAQILSKGMAIQPVLSQKERTTVILLKIKFPLGTISKQDKIVSLDNIKKNQWKRKGMYKQN